MSYVLVVDDDRQICDLVQGMLNEIGWESVAFQSGAAAILEMREKPPAFVVSDLVMADMDGMELVNLLRNGKPVIPIIVMSGNPVARQFLKSAVTLGARAALTKPFTVDELRYAVEELNLETGPA